MTDTPTATPLAPDARHRRRSCVLLAIVLVLLLANYLVWIGLVEKAPSVTKPTQVKAHQAPVEPSFAGSSDKLKQTIVVPTLETPVAEGQSVIWCATLAMAWRELERTVAKGALDIDGAEKIAWDLRQTPPAGLSPEHYYVAAGLHKDRIWERIRRELPKKFPEAPLPPLPARDEIALAYAYLQAAIRYEHEFNYSDTPLKFQDAAGKQTAVHAFGIRERDARSGIGTYRKQVEVLFRDDAEFALDLSRGTRPYQVIVARLNRQANHKATLQRLDDKLAEARANKGISFLADDDILLVPYMHWKIEHYFAELETKTVRHPSFPPGTFLGNVRQLIHLKMDARGTEIASGARVTADWSNDGPASFLFDRPYLVVLKKRGEAQPFFVLWVANAELLYAWERER